jgi:hypothetical protein
MLKPAFSATGHVDGQREPGTTDRQVVFSIDNHDVGQCVIDLEEVHRPISTQRRGPHWSTLLRAVFNPCRFAIKVKLAQSYQTRKRLFANSFPRQESLCRTLDASSQLVLSECSGSRKKSHPY